MIHDSFDYSQHSVLKNVLSKWQTDALWLEQFARAAQNKDLVTFDIFDTALTRDSDSSFDIFARVEQELSAANNRFIGFAAAREKAEEAARIAAKQQSNHDEIIFAEIYNVLPQCLELSPAEIEQAKACEMRHEERTLCAVPDILAAVQKLRQMGIAYAFVSDMYLPQDFLEKIILREGYQNWQRCIVSSSVRKTKGHGTIWALPFLKGKSILHIGDNLHADIKRPRDFGIETLLYSRAQSHRRYGAELTPEILPFSHAHRCAEMAAHSVPETLSEFSQPQAKQTEQNKREMYALGQSFGALILGSFTLWLQQRAKINGITHLAFCARDGWLMQQAWHILTAQENSGISDSYLHISRKTVTLAEAALLCTPETIAPVILNFLTEYERHTTIGDIAQRLAEISPEAAEKAAKFLAHPQKLLRRNRKRTLRKLKHFLQQESALLYAGFQKKYAECTAYFTQEKLFEHKKTAFVDMGWRGTLQRGVNRICRSVDPDFSCVGFYYGLWREALSNRHESGVMESAFWGEFLPPQIQQKLWHGVCILENLHSSAEGSTSGYHKHEGQWRAITKTSAQETEIFQNIVIPFQQGALAALRQLAETGQTEYGLTKKDLTIENGLAAYKALILSPSSAEIAALGQIIHSAGYDHSSFIPLILPNLPWLNKRLRRVLWGQEWRTGQMRYWLNITQNSRKERALRHAIHHEFYYLSERELRCFH